MAAAVGAVRKKATKKATAKKLPNRLKVGELTYTKKSCARLKSSATKQQKKLKESGLNVRVKKDPVTGTYCLFTRKSKVRKATTTAKRKTTTRAKAKK